MLPLHLKHRAGLLSEQDAWMAACCVVGHRGTMGLSDRQREREECFSPQWLTVVLLLHTHGCLLPISVRAYFWFFFKIYFLKSTLGLYRIKIQRQERFPSCVLKFYNNKNNRRQQSPSSHKPPSQGAFFGASSPLCHPFFFILSLLLSASVSFVHYYSPSLLSPVPCPLCVGLCFHSGWITARVQRSFLQSALSLKTHKQHTLFFSSHLSHISSLTHTGTVLHLSCLACMSSSLWPAGIHLFCLMARVALTR